MSCHGHNHWRAPGSATAAPVLMMEDEEGGERPTSAAELARLVTKPPRLVFVSACLTATSADTGDQLPPAEGHKSDWSLAESGPVDGGGRLVAHSLATELVAAGMPTVIGWDGSVDDRAATVFAREMYGALAQQADLAVAVGDARRALLSSSDAVARADWHLARLWLGPAGGGPVVAGTRKRSLCRRCTSRKRSWTANSIRCLWPPRKCSSRQRSASKIWVRTVSDNRVSRCSWARSC